MTCFVIAGAARTGSSLTANIIRELGIWFGENSDLKDGYNIHIPSVMYGYCEHKLLEEYVEEELTDTAHETPITNILNHIRRSNYKWGLKIPKPHTPQGIRILRLIKDNIKIVVTKRRDNAARIASFRRAIHHHKQDVSKLYEDINKEAALLKAPTTLIHYEDYFSIPREIVQKLADFIDEPFKESALDLIDPKLKHF